MAASRQLASRARRVVADRTNRQLGHLGLVMIRSQTLADLRRRGAEGEILRDKLAQLRERLAPAAGLPLPVYLTADLKPSLQPRTGASPHPVVVVSIPKAGTYLVAELLDRLGCVPTKLHLMSTYVSDYRQASLKEMREEYARFTLPMSVAQVLPLIRAGQFAVGHLECTDEMRRLLAPFKTIFVYRDLRDVIVSHMRFFVDTGRGGDATQTWCGMTDGPEKLLACLDHSGENLFCVCRPMAGWIEEPSVLRVSFETLYGDAGERAQRELVRRLADFLEVPVPKDDPGGLLSAVIGARTKTWSGSRSRRDIYWSDAVERRFQALGGGQLNARLGYI